MIKKTLILILLFLAQNSYSQLRIDTSQTVEYLVKKVLLGKESNLIVSNIKYKGSKQALALFRNSLKHNQLISKGIIISTGNVFDAIGPNNTSGKSTENCYGSAGKDKDLSLLVNAKTFDAAILEFDFISLSDSISFNFFFASEEYPEYVKKNVNDVFAFFLTSKELGFNTNLAVLPTNNPISIDNINSSTNSEYFIENGLWEKDNISKWKNNLQLGELAYTFQFDGFSILFNVGSKVIPNHKYHLKLAIADIGDRYYDSAVFFQAESFNSNGNIPKKEEISLNELVTTEFNDDIISVSDSSITINLNIEFEYNSAKFIGKYSYKLLDKVFNLLKNDVNMLLEIQGHTGSIGTIEYNKILSENRALNVLNYLIEKGIASNRIISFGFGETKPISENNKLNRRVEFVFKRK